MTQMVMIQIVLQEGTGGKVGQSWFHVAEEKVINNKNLSEAKFSDFIIPTLFSVPAGSLYY